MSRVRIQMSMLAALLVVASCSTTADLSAPHSRSADVVTSSDSVRVPLKSIQSGLLQVASWGLLYTSESDYPFVYFRRTGLNRPTTTALSVAEFKQLLGIAPSTVVEVISLDTFFARHIERVDPADDVAQALVPRYVNLRETLRTRLAQVVVYRVGTIAIDCYIVGFDVSGNLEGLTTISIET